MTFITRIDNAFVWLRKKGVYIQAELYRRGEALFAKTGGGYVRLSISGGTSVPTVTWLEIDPGDLAVLDTRDGQIPVYKGEQQPQITAKKPARVRRVA